MHISKLSLGLSLLALAVTAAAEVYRCAGEFGEPFFSQRPCRGGSTVVIRTGPADVAPGPGLRPSERAWLAGRELAQGRNSAAKRRVRRDQAAIKRKAKTQAHRCRSKRRSLDEVRARLRRGYQPAQGEKLRRRRRAYEDYLATFCS
jgi:hypothetical protein